MDTAAVWWVSLVPFSTKPSNSFSRPAQDDVDMIKLGNEADGYKDIGTSRHVRLRQKDRISVEESQRKRDENSLR